MIGWVQAEWYLTLCVQNIAHKNEALHGYVSPRVWPRELYRLEIALKIIMTVPSNILYFVEEEWSIISVVQNETFTCIFQRLYNATCYVYCVSIYLSLHLISIVLELFMNLQIVSFLKFIVLMLDGRKCSHFLANYNSFFKLIFEQSEV